MAYDESKLVKLGQLKAVAEMVKEAQDASILGVKVNGTALTVANDQTVNIPIAEGATNGTVSVNGADVAVHGLGDLAYKSEVGTSDLATELADTISAKAANSTVNTLIGSDTGKSVRTIAAEELAAQLIPANAQDSMDTLQEISAWIQAHPAEAAALNAKLTLGTRNVTTYVAATGTYVSGTTYYTDDTGATEVDATSFTEGVTDVSAYYVAQTTSVQYGNVKAYVEAMTSGLIKLDALSVTVTGDGNAVTAASYNSATGVLTLTKGATFAQTSQIATDAEVTEMLTEIFGAAS